MKEIEEEVNMKGDGKENIKTIKEGKKKKRNKPKNVRNISVCITCIHTPVLFRKYSIQKSDILLIPLT
jgi:hypothetical protein